MKFGFGQALTRKEDDPLMRGAGRYVADVAPAALCMRWWCARRMPMRDSALAISTACGRCRACGWC